MKMSYGDYDRATRGERPEQSLLSRIEQLNKKKKTYIFLLI